jgi:hypothetical protein
MLVSKPGVLLWHFGRLGIESLDGIDGWAALKRRDPGGAARVMLVAAAMGIPESVRVRKVKVGVCVANVLVAADMVAVDSSAITAVGFVPYSEVPESAEKDLGTLYVEFQPSKADVAAGRPGATWAYPDVPALMHGEMMAGSVGSYFHKHIKNSYGGRRIS